MFIVTYRDGNQEIYVLRANAYDEGLYSCSATNIYGIVESNKVWIEVLIPPEVTQPVVSKIAAEGSTVLMQCTVFGDPAPTITWFKGIIL